MLILPYSVTCFLLIVLVVISLVLLMLAIKEPYKLEKSTVYLNKNTFGKQVFEKATDCKETSGLRVFYFSDLHVEFCFIKPQVLVSEIKKAHEEMPLDIIVFGGDVANSIRSYKKGVKYLSYIKDAADELGIPFYGVTGNHDYKFDSEMDMGLGFNLIENKAITAVAKSNGKEYVIGGVDDSGRHERVWHDIPDGVNVVFAHNPDVILHLKDTDKADYIISGHIHGGQIRTPFRIEFSTLVRHGDKLPSMGVTAGTYTYKDTTLYISRGIGCVMLPFRLGATPEISVITIE